LYFPNIYAAAAAVAILELSDGSGDEIEYNQPSHSNPADDSKDKEVSDEEKLQEETDEQELGNLF
jgi:hypothetical protein